jgi:regulator of replication initiation timing
VILDWFRTQHALVTRVEAKDAELAEYGRAFDALTRAAKRNRERNGRLSLEVKTLRRQLAEANEQLQVQAGIGRAVFPPFTRAQTEAIEDHAHDKRTDDGLGDN